MEGLAYWLDIPGDHVHYTGEPILRARQTDTQRVYALGGLHYMRGNSAPYFALTMASWERRNEAGKWVEASFGAALEDLTALWPDLQPLADLHLSDWNGVPMHAEANGFYQLAGYAGGLGERYHAGNAERYGKLETLEETRARCLRQWATHVRLPMADARKAADAILSEGYAIAKARAFKTEPGVTFEQKAIGLATRAVHAEWIAAQTERWAEEARACLEALGITYYYGDRMPEAKEPV